MYGIDHVNSDVMRAELAYRREQLTGGRRYPAPRLGRRYRVRRSPSVNTR
jgi:hypothetical protein